MTPQERARLAELQTAAQERKLSPDEMDEVVRLKKKKKQDDEADSGAADNADRGGLSGGVRAPEDRSSQRQDAPLAPLQAEDAPTFHGPGFLADEDEEDDKDKIKVENGGVTRTRIMHEALEFKRQMDEDAQRALGRSQPRPGRKGKDGGKDF